MNMNRIILSVLAASLLGSQPILAADPPKPNTSTSNLIDRAKREWRELKEAVKCARKQGFRKCSRAQKKRIVIAGLALAAAIAATVYVVKPRTFAQQAQLNAKLFNAIKEGSLWKVKWLLLRGAAINTPIGGYAPLHVAVVQGKEDIVRFLISEDADINERTRDYKTALDLAKGNIKEYLEKNTDAQTDEQLKAEKQRQFEAEQRRKGTSK